MIISLNWTQNYKLPLLFYNTQNNLSNHTKSIMGLQDRIKCYHQEYVDRHLQIDYHL